MHVFNYSTQEAEECQSLILKAVWDTELVLGQGYTQKSYFEKTKQ